MTDVVSGDVYPMQLAGTGGFGVVSLTPSPLVFPARAVECIAVPTTVTLTNSGNAMLNVSSIKLGGANAGVFVDSALPGACAQVPVGSELRHRYLVFPDGDWNANSDCDDRVETLGLLPTYCRFLVWAAMPSCGRPD